MTDKEKAKIRRLEKDYTSRLNDEPELEKYNLGRRDAYHELLSFSDSMQEELSTLEQNGKECKDMSDDLEEEIKKEYKKMFGNNETIRITSLGFVGIARHFVNWQKQQMMKMAVDGVVCFGSKGAYVVSDWLGTTDVETYGDSGSKVRIIVLKEE